VTEIVKHYLYVPLKGNRIEIEIEISLLTKSGPQRAYTNNNYD
jgi:hypothetical protein